MVLLPAACEVAVMASGGIGVGRVQDAGNLVPVHPMLDCGVEEVSLLRVEVQPGGFSHDQSDAMAAEHDATHDAFLRAVWSVFHTDLRSTRPRHLRDDQNMPLGPDHIRQESPGTECGRPHFRW